jgi:hypothetical protein
MASTLEQLAKKNNGVTPDFITEWKIVNKISKTDNTDYSFRIINDFKTLKNGSSITTNNNGKSSSSGDGGFFESLNPSKIVGDLIATQEKTGYMPGLSDEMVKTSKAVSGVIDMFSLLKSPTLLISDIIGKLGDQTELYLQQQTELLGVINKEAGVTGEFSENIRQELTQANVPLLRLGIGFEELARASKDLISSSGRFITLNKQSWYEAGLAATAYVGTLAELVDMYPEFEKVGIGASDVAEKITEAGSRSLNLGLQSSKITKELSTNLSKLNEYGFQNGIKGLTNMVQKSAEFRMNLSEVFKIADKVMDPDGAIGLAANLQVLGGAMGDFGDPLKLMYDATNNVEGLQDALIGAASSLATYNSEQGRFEITGVNLRRAKAMAQELGVSYDELAKGAISAAERTSASVALMSSGLKLDEDQERFLTNISQMKGGQMMIELNGDKIKEVLGVDSDAKEIALEKLTQTQVDTILKYQDEFKELSSKDIADKQLTVTESIGRDLSFLTGVARLRAAELGGGYLEKLAKQLGFNPDDAKKTVSSTADDVAKFLGYKNINKKTNATPKTNESMSVNNRPKKETTNESNLLSDLKRDLSVAVKEGVVEGNNVTKYNSRQNITVQTVVNEENPNSYTYYSIGGR